MENLETNEICSEKDKKRIAKIVMDELFLKMDYEKFLNIFNDKYNWFGYIGISEEDYQNLSSIVNKETNKTSYVKSLKK